MKWIARRLAAWLRPYLGLNDPGATIIQSCAIEVEQLNADLNILRREFTNLLRSRDSLTTSNLNLLEEIFTCQNEIRAFGSYLRLDLVGDEDNPHVVPSVEARAELEQAKQTVRDRALEAEEQKTLRYLLDVMRRRDKEVQQRQPRPGITKEMGR